MANPTDAALPVDDIESATARWRQIEAPPDAAWPYRATVGFRTAEDRDEFLREHVDRACSDIDADLHLLDGAVWVALHEEREFVGIFSTRDAAIRWANERCGTWPDGSPRDYVYDVFETTVDDPGGAS